MPKLGELRKLGTGADTPPAEPMAAGAATAPRAAFAALMAIAAIALVGAAYCMVRYFAIEVPATTDEHLAEIDLAYSQMPLGQLVREWQEMIDFTPEIASPYLYQIIADEKAGWLRSGVIGFVIAAISGGLSFVCISLGRSKA